MATLFGPPDPSSPLFEAQMFHRTQLWSFLSLPDQARAGSVPPQTSITSPPPPRGLSSPALPWAQGVPELPTGTRRVRGPWLRPVPPVATTHWPHLGYNREKWLGEKEEVRGDTAQSDELCMTIGK